MPNDEQLDALNEMIDFAYDGSKRVMTLSGYAGTGKTTIMGMLYRVLRYRMPVQFAATTHKAAGVLRSKVGTKVTTVNSLFGIMIETDLDGDFFDATKKKREYAQDKLKKNGIVIIDEASMLNEENYDDVIRLCDEFNCKVIFVGDPAQLSPVKEKDISKVFRLDNGKVITLTKIERTDDDSILTEATNVRQGIPLSYETKTNVYGDGVNYINIKEPGAIKNEIEKYIDGLFMNPNHFRILTFTNASVSKFNFAVRKMLQCENIPKAGEPLMAYDNWGWDGGTYKCINSESYTVKRNKGTRKVRINDYITHLSLPDDLYVEIVDLELIDSIDKTFIAPYVDVVNNANNYEATRYLAYEKIELWRDYKACGSNQYKKWEVLDKIRDIDSLLFVNDYIRDEYDHVLQNKTIDFGYAHTIHKSQGSTFNNVLINDREIEAYCRDKSMKQQLKYVALTRASNNVSILY